jgi:hypothetical protein
MPIGIYQMKSMRELINLLESLSSVVYHATDMLAALQILKTNALRSEAGYISTTRSLTGSYHRENKMIGVIFELNGTLINQRYRSSPIGTENFNYWDNDDTDEEPWLGRSNGQLEDRIYTNELSPLNKYVTRAIIFLPTEYINRQTSCGTYADEFDTSYADQLKVVKQVEDLLDGYNIPTRIVETEKGLYKRT